MNEDIERSLSQLELIRSLEEGGAYAVWIRSYAMSHGRRLACIAHRGNYLQRIAFECVDTVEFHGVFECESTRFQILHDVTDRIEVIALDAPFRVVCGALRRLDDRPVGLTVARGVQVPIVPTVDSSRPDFGGVCPQAREVGGDVGSPWIGRTWSIQFANAPVGAQALADLASRLGERMDFATRALFTHVAGDVVLASIDVSPEIWERSGDWSVLAALDDLQPIAALQGVPRTHWRLFHEAGVGPMVG